MLDCVVESSYRFMSFAMRAARAIWVLSWLTLPSGFLTGLAGGSVWRVCRG